MTTTTTATTTMGTPRDVLRAIVRGAYDLQHLRVQMGNRIVASKRVSMGVAPGTREDDASEDVQEILRVLRKEYVRITDGLKNFPTRGRFQGTEIISSYAELLLISQYDVLCKNEDDHFRRLGHALADFPIYSQFLADVRGIGPAMAGVIVAEFNIHVAKYPSSFWKYAGLDTGPDGAGRSRRPEHLVQREYKAADGTTKTRASVTFNPFVKTKLMGVLAGSFLRAGNVRYKGIYDAYKFRLETHPVYGTQNDGTKDHRGLFVSKARRHEMSLRYMIKMFLVDLHTRWCEIEGLPVVPPYSEGKLGIVHRGGEIESVA